LFKVVSGSEPLAVLAYGDGSPYGPIPPCLQHKELCERSRYCCATFVTRLSAKSFGERASFTGELGCNVLNFNSKRTNSTSKSSNVIELVTLSKLHSSASVFRAVFEEILKVPVLLFLVTDSDGIFKAVYSFAPDLAEETLRYRHLLQSLREELNPRLCGDSAVQAAVLHTKDPLQIADVGTKVGVQQKAVYTKWLDTGVITANCRCSPVLDAESFDNRQYPQLKATDIITDTFAAHVECNGDDNSIVYDKLPQGPRDIHVVIYGPNGKVLQERYVQAAKRFVTFSEQNQNNWSQVVCIVTRCAESGEVLRNLTIQR